MLHGSTKVVVRTVALLSAIQKLAIDILTSYLTLQSELRVHHSSTLRHGVCLKYNLPKGLSEVRIFLALTLMRQWAQLIERQLVIALLLLAVPVRLQILMIAVRMPPLRNLTLTSWKRHTQSLPVCRKAWATSPVKERQWGSRVMPGVPLPGGFETLLKLANVPRTWPLARLTIPLSGFSKQLEWLLSSWLLKRTLSSIMEPSNSLQIFFVWMLHGLSGRSPFCQLFKGLQVTSD